jgi:acylpyruvate hydrolase
VRFAAYRSGHSEGLAVRLPDGEFRGVPAKDAKYPGNLATLIAAGPRALKDAAAVLAGGVAIDPRMAKFPPPLPAPGKIVCVRLNYVDHSVESGFTPPTYPTIFARFASSLIGHETPILRPAASIQLDYEGEMVAVIGKGGRHIPKSQAPRACCRLLDLQRCLDPRLPDQVAAMDRRQEFRLHRRLRPVLRDS